MLLLFGAAIANGQAIPPKQPTDFTAAANAAMYHILDFSNRQDFEDAQRGFIAGLEPPRVIPNDIQQFNQAGYYAWDMEGFQFLNGMDAPASANPSLWRQEQLNNFNGLFEVVKGTVYQVRSFDLAVMSFIRGRTGWIVIDPLMTRETARAGLELFRGHVSPDPVVAVLLTHSHADHMGGLPGLVAAEGSTIAQSTRGKKGGILVYGPAGLFQEALSENLFLGNVMERRSDYMYGKYLEKSPYRSIGMGLGKTHGFGTLQLAKPTAEITENCEMVIDKVRVRFQLAPGSEAPAEMHIFFPEYGAFCPGENVSHVMHNLLTSRGAKVRDPKAWAGYIDEAIDLFGPQIQVMIGTHHWPVWGNQRCLDLMERQRDMYRFFNDQVIRMLNQGMNMEEIAEHFELPTDLDKEFYNRGYYGTKNHNVKAVVQRYVGWWDGNPANYYKYPEEEAAKRYVEFMGGESAVIQKARTSYEQGDYRWVVEVMKHVVFANPGNKEAKELQADAMEQLGYTFESGTWRDIFLSGAEELRNGSFPIVGNRDLAGTMSQIPPTMLFDYFSTLIMGKLAENANLSMRFIFTDEDLPAPEQNLYVLLKHGVLHCKNNKPNESTMATYTLTKAEFIQLLQHPMQTGNIQVQGDPTMFAKLLAYFTKRPPQDWNIVLPLWYDNTRK